MLNILLFIKRIRHCAGFGVQSPSDYAFVRNVIYERWPYYAYLELQQKYSDATEREHWIGRLLLRVSNYAQAKRIVSFGTLSDMRRDYLLAGCSKSDITYGKFLDDGDLIIVDAPCKHGIANWKWLNSQPNIVAFDLYYIGIAFCNRKRYAETHIINPY